MRAFTPFLSFLLLAAFTLPLAGGESLPLRDNERIIVLTDAAVTDSSWPVLLEQYLRVRYPEKNLTFFTLSFEEKGISEAVEHLQDGILTLRPTLILIHFGPESATGTKVSWRLQQNFTEMMERLCSNIARNNVPFAVVGGYRGEEEGRFQLLWSAFRAAAQSVASEQKGRWIDLGPLMKKYSGKNVPVTIRGHLTEAGHVAALISILQNFNWVVPVDLEVPGSKGDVTLHPAASGRMTFWMQESIEEWTMKESSIAEALHPFLRVSDLSPGKYLVSVDGVDAGTFDAERLETGIYLRPGITPRSSLVREWVSRKQGLFSTEWLEALRFEPSTGRQHLLAGSLTAEEGFEDMICHLSKGPDSLHLTMTRTATP